jgi:transcriptional regulator with XRE-family HTH domain
MYGNPQRRAAADVRELRREGGKWLRELRERAGLSQRQLASQVGAEYYTFISQLETGRGRIPPDRYIAWAKALNISPQVFVRTIMRFYDPVTYGIVFPTDAPVPFTEPAPDLSCEIVSFQSSGTPVDPGTGRRRS